MGNLLTNIDTNRHGESCTGATLHPMPLAPLRAGLEEAYNVNPVQRLLPIVNVDRLCQLVPAPSDLSIAHEKLGW